MALNKAHPRVVEVDKTASIEIAFYTKVSAGIALSGKISRIQTEKEK